MSVQLHQKLPYLIILKEACPKVRKSILQASDKKLINVISECVYNALRNPGVKLSAACIKKLKPFKVYIRKVADPKLHWLEKKKILVKPKQIGGWIIPLITSLLGSAIPAIINKFTGPKKNE
jgi:hypothetical protein